MMIKDAIWRPPLDNHFFEKNLALLKIHASGPIDLSDEMPDKIILFDSNSGQPTAQYENILLHSKYDPEKEGRDFSQKIQPGSKICLYGFGLGYHLAPLLEKIGPDGFLLVIELNQDILTAAMRIKDHTPLFQNPNFKFIFGVEEAQVSHQISREMENLSESNPEKIEILFHSPSFKCFPQKFPSLKNALEILLMERRFPAVFGNLENTNYSLNEEKIKKSRGINSLSNTHSGRPGIVISAGPSLDTVLPYLKYLKDRFLITCVDTAFPVLLRNRIQPEYVFSLDPQSESALYFADYKRGSTKLIFTTTANHTVLENFPGECFVVYKEAHSPSQSDEAEEKGITQAGGSVSCLGLDVLIQLGCNPIFLIGQDCALTGNRYYSKHTRFNQLLVARVNGAQPLDKLHQGKFNEKNPVKIK
ncbi:MAG: 6-hydroxymethylpterin diphosphokinase MptE-like protein, partial [Nitrospinota bacterium]